MNYRSFILAVSILCLLDSSARAHHSWPATYDLNQTVRVEGEVARFLYRNPHSIVQVMVSTQTGEFEKWDAEWGGTFELLPQGVSRNTLRRGDRIVLTGHPGRNPNDRKLRVLTVERPSDGFEWGLEPGETFN